MLAILICLLAAGAEPALEAPPKPVVVAMVAMRATREGRADKYFDRGLESVREAVAELPYDTYRHVVSTQATVPYEREVPFSINSRHTLFITPLSRDSAGRIRLKTRVQRIPQPGEKTDPLNALVATSMVVPGDRLKLCLPLEDAALVIVLSVNES
jgi:hypothetical protein